MTNQTKESSDLVGQRAQRIEKAKKLRDLGIDPFPAKSFRTATNKEIIASFEKFEGKETTLSGRVSAKRGHGKLIFMDLVDDSAKVQVYVKEDELGKLNISNKDAQYLGFENLDLIDIADYIEVVGDITKTERGEISILAKKIRILVKTIRPLPLHLEDKEERFRRRYVDMKVHPEVKERMKRRALFWEAHREFFNKLGFYEVNIPILEHVPGGGDAVPFTTHMNAIDEDFFLRISHELPLKRLIGAGFEKVYDIGARFRNEGLSDEHLPEHNAMEFYWAYADWKDGMKMIEDMFNYIVSRVYPGQKKFQIREFEIEFKEEWDILDFNEVMKERYGIKSVYTVTIDEVKELLTKNGIAFERSINVPRGIDALWKKIRKTVAGPAFLVNHPKYLSPLQKPSLDNPDMVERFQPIIAGSELGNGWSELNDPIEQYERFLEQQKLRDAGDEEAQWLDIDYVEMLEYGMPPTFGYGHSERVFWFLENVTAREGVPFPQLKQEFDELTKKIYPEIDFSEMESKKSGSSKKEVSFEYENVQNLPSIEDANALLEKYVTDDYHKLHAKMVATGLRAYAKKFGVNEKLWYITGLLHDLDYTQFPDEHPFKELELFKQWGYPEELIHAVAAHDHINTGEAPRTPLAKAIIAVDEMAGLIYAYSIMKDGGFKNLDAKSTLKKFNDKKFAAKIDRDEIMFGVNKLGLNLEEHIDFLIKAFANMSDAVSFSDSIKTQDFSNRIAIVVNEDLEKWQITNAVAHVSAYLGHKLDERFGTVENFVTKDGKNHPRNSQYAIVVLAAKPGQMSNFMEKVRESKLLYHGFIREMIETTDDEKITEILNGKSDAEIEYLGIGVYGDNETLKKLTNKFSLLK